MTISSLSSALGGFSPAQNLAGAGNSRRQEFAELAKALQSGNLSEAQQAYAALQQTGAPFSSPDSNNSPAAGDFKALGQALASGNLNQAQGAFSQLQDDINTGQPAASQGSTNHLHGHHHHYHGGANVDQANALSPANTTGNTNTRSINLLG